MKYEVETLKHNGKCLIALKRVGVVHREEEPLVAERMEVDGYIEATFSNKVHYVPKSDLWMYEPRIEKKREGIIKTQYKIIKRLEAEIDRLKGKKS